MKLVDQIEHFRSCHSGLALFLARSTFALPPQTFVAETAGNVSCGSTQSLEMMLSCEQVEIGVDGLPRFLLSLIVVLTDLNPITVKVSSYFR